MSRTYVILDGLTDPRQARDLSIRWKAADFDNGVDPTGQSAWLAHASTLNPQPAALAESDIDRAAAIARAFGLELRDRAGAAFTPDNNLAQLRQRLAYEYKSRLATALMFGLPAIALHYLTPFLTGGIGRGPTAVIYPWLFEMLLVGWMLIAAGWPILWQGLLSLIRLKPTPDLLTTVIVAAAFLPSAFGNLVMIVTGKPWFGIPGQSPLRDGGVGPAYLVANLTITFAILQRWLVHRSASRLAGRADLLIPRVGLLMGLWAIASITLMFTAGWRWGLAFGMVMPPMLSLGAVNRWSPGIVFLLPVAAFAVLLLLGPDALHLKLAPRQPEAAAAFALMMTAVFALGWRGWHAPKP